MCASCTRPGYIRTSWKVGLATGESDSVPRATPRTKVVFPAPSSPVSKTRSPAFSRLPRPSPTASVSAAEFVTTSGKVVVAGELELHRHPVGAEHLHGGIVGEETKRPQTCFVEQLLRAGTDQLGLFAAGQRLLQRRPICGRHVGGADDAARARECDELVHLAEQPVGDVAAAEPGLVQPPAFFQQRQQTEGAPLTPVSYTHLTLPTNREV